jgi:hypothetical protein
MSKAHHPFGPSSLKQKLTCLASYNATKDAPDQDSEASLLGTAAHELVEMARERNRPAQDFFGTEITVKRVDGTKKTYIVDKDMIDSAQTFIDHVNETPGFDFNEQRIHYARFVPPNPDDPEDEGGFGTLDAARITPCGRRGVFSDFKHGKGVQVYATDNDQLLGCALGFFEDWGHIFDEIEEVDLWIVQPRRDWKDKWTVSKEFVYLWAVTRLAPRHTLALALAPDAPFTPGKHCDDTFCKIRAFCGARAKSTFTTVVEDFSDMDDAIAKVDKVPSAVGRLSNEQIAALLPKLAAVKTWCKAIEGYAFAELAAGRQVGKCKLVRGEQGDRAFVPEAEEKLVDAAIDAQINAEELFEPRALKSPAQVEKILGKPHFKPPTDKKEAGKFFSLMTRAEGRLKLAFEDDPRPAVASAVDDFEDLDEAA